VNDLSSGINITGSTSNTKNTELSHYEKELHKAKVAFLYTEPPGLKKQIEKERKKIEEEKRLKDWQEALQHMSKEERRLAEKEMEEGLSVHERNARRFEFLKNAPMVDDYVKNIEGVVHKPFGKVIKHVKCFKCGKWGHSVGDRECEHSVDFTSSFAIPDKKSMREMEEKFNKEKNKLDENNNDDNNNNISSDDNDDDNKDDDENEDEDDENEDKNEDENEDEDHKHKHNHKHNHSHKKHHHHHHKKKKKTP